MARLSRALLLAVILIRFAGQISSHKICRPESASSLDESKSQRPYTLSFMNSLSPTLFPCLFKISSWENLNRSGRLKSAQEENIVRSLCSLFASNRFEQFTYFRWIAFLKQSHCSPPISCLFDATYSMLTFSVSVSCPFLHLLFHAFLLLTPFADSGKGCELLLLQSLGAFRIFNSLPDSFGQHTQCVLHTHDSPISISVAVRLSCPPPRVSKNGIIAIETFDSSLNRLTLIEIRL